MRIQTILILILATLLAGCKIYEKEFVGTYSLKNYPKTTLNLNQDYSFEFVKNVPNPFLHPFDHPDRNYFRTNGTWVINKKNEIEITSTKDSIESPLFSLDTLDSKNKELSKIVFFDSWGDTVPILYTQYSDSSNVHVMHGRMYHYAEDLTKRDTLEFHFYGYSPFILNNYFRNNKTFHIVLFEEFRPNYFESLPFEIKRNRLIDKERNVSFKRMKNAL